jgi:hypothetical protein
MRLPADQDGVLYAHVADSGDVELRVWTAASAEESEEIRRFEQAAAQIDWGVPGAHEVRWELVPRSNPRLTSPEGPRLDGPENEVFDRVALTVADDSVPLPTAAALDEFERAENFALPEGYRRFVLRFGPGSFRGRGAQVSVASPGYPKDLPWFDLARLNRWYRRLDWDDEELRAMYGANTARVRRLVLFASDDGGDDYGWDPRDVTVPGRHEYGVYHLPRHGRPVMRRVARSFAEFVARRCLPRGGRRTYRAHHDYHARQYDLVKAFLDETGWPLGPGQDVGDFAHGLDSHMHCSPRSKLSLAFKKWKKGCAGTGSP